MKRGTERGKETRSGRGIGERCAKGKEQKCQSKVAGLLIPSYLGFITAESLPAVILIPFFFISSELSNFYAW